MRLSETERTFIRDTVRELFGPHARVRLFGSRTDDAARGGDIDLLIECPEPLPDRAARTHRLVARLQMRLGNQRIDALVIDPTTPATPIVRVAQHTGIAI
ncbi:hypothetical protein Tfont_00441 [Tepidimonas fonticaldi]|uniref:Polymerase nucleotidyl transferase domain-containing protein n=1 Tax=Tepidimonas fonticaldi TaxID=1101373 RepID=A0A554XPM4_9BURK|nr:nucleotidyltransferase domain-containing protein [Tepidimonas fonticaldi]TSE37789.1 hypothetical protein Tfont_00441 [Tepidimonas fonticaldi]